MKDGSEGTSTTIPCTTTSSVVAAAPLQHAQQNKVVLTVPFGMTGGQIMPPPPSVSIPAVVIPPGLKAGDSFTIMLPTHFLKRPAITTPQDACGLSLERTAEALQAELNERRRSQSNFLNTSSSMKLNAMSMMANPFPIGNVFDPSCSHADAYAATLGSPEEVSKRNVALLEAALSQGDRLMDARREISRLAFDELPELATAYAPDSFDLTGTCEMLDCATVVHNPHALPGTPLYERFVRHMGSTTVEGRDLEVQLVYHGTSPSNITPILRDGLDPRFRGRHGQAFGPGEYFARRAWRSLYYCSSPQSRTCSMIVFAVLVDPGKCCEDALQRKLTARGWRSTGDIVVVSESEWQLPLATITFEGPDEAVWRAAKLAATWQRAAQRAEAAAQRGLQRASLFRRLMASDIYEAAEIFSKHFQDGISEMPALRSELIFYLRNVDRDTVLALFPGVIPNAERWDPATGRFLSIASPVFQWPPTPEMLRNDSPSASLAHGASSALEENVDAEVLVEAARRARKVAEQAEAGARAARLECASRLGRKRAQPEGDTPLGAPSSAKHFAGGLRHATAIYPPKVPRQEVPSTTTAAVLRQLQKLQRSFQRQQSSAGRPSEASLKSSAEASLTSTTSEASLTSSSDASSAVSHAASSSTDASAHTSAAPSVDKKCFVSTAQGSTEHPMGFVSTTQGSTELPMSLAAGPLALPSFSSGVPLVNGLSMRASLFNLARRVPVGNACAPSASQSVSAASAISSSAAAAPLAPTSAPAAATAGTVTAADGTPPTALTAAIAAAAADMPSTTLTRAVAALPSFEVTDQGASAAADMTVSLPDESNALCWRVEMMIPEGSKLRRSLEDHGVRFHVRPTVELELSFGTSFPTTPPFVRVVAPRFAFHTGHVTVGGSICLELLTTSGWRSDYTIEAILVAIRQVMIDGDGRLDPTRAHLPYDEAEARMAFGRVAREHGWTP